VSRNALRPFVLLAAAALIFAGCDKIPTFGAKAGFDKDRLEAALDPSVGGPDTCMVIEDVRTGAEVYRYGAQSVCNRPLAPCATFQIPLALIGISTAVLKPDQVQAWDGKPQPYKAWEHDADLKGAWRTGSSWYFQRLARTIGPNRFKKQLTDFGYGQGEPLGRPDSFWQGPAAGGGLFLSTRNQADVLRKLARGELSASPEAANAVLDLMADVTRGDVTLSDLGASCPSIADASRDVSWWIGRIRGTERDVVFALSIESQNPLPGSEIRSRALPIFTSVGLLPIG
jgi:beta-lactamase class D